MPPPMDGSAARTSAADASETTLAGSSGSRSQPSTSVRNISLYAPIAPATAPAASSALMLCDTPSRSAPTEATTGM